MTVDRYRATLRKCRICCLKLWQWCWSCKRSIGHSLSSTTRVDHTRLTSYISRAEKADKPAVERLEWVTDEMKTRRALDGAHVLPTKVFRRLTGSVNKTMLKALFAAATNRPTYTSDFPRRKNPRSSAYTIVEKAIRFWHPQTIIRIGLN